MEPPPKPAGDPIPTRQFAHGAAVLRDMGWLLVDAVYDLGGVCLTVTVAQRSKGPAAAWPTYDVLEEFPKFFPSDDFRTRAQPDEGVAMTPEGKIKQKIKALLIAHGAIYTMPIGSAYGAVTLDYVGGHKGRSFWIEAKAPGKTPTKLQNATINRIIAARAGAVFIIDGPYGLERLEDWLKEGVAE